MRDFDELKDKYNKLQRENKILNSTKEDLEYNLKETYDILKDE